MEIQVNQDHKEVQDLLVQLDLSDNRDQMELLAVLEQQERWVSRVIQDPLDKPDHKALLDLLVDWVLQETQDRKDQLEIQDLLVNPGARVQLVLSDNKDQMVNQVRLDFRDNQDQLEAKDSRVHKEAKVTQDLKVTWDRVV